MKTILVDAAYAFVIETENGFEVFEPMRKMLDEFPNRKIILMRELSIFLEHNI